MSLKKHFGSKITSQDEYERYLLEFRNLANASIGLATDLMYGEKISHKEPTIFVGKAQIDLDSHSDKVVLEASQ